MGWEASRHFTSGAETSAAPRQGTPLLERCTVARLTGGATPLSFAGDRHRRAYGGRGKRTTSGPAQAPSEPVMSVRSSASRNGSTDTSCSMFDSDRNNLTRGWLEWLG
jgi:hypothetical protein